MSSYSIKLFYGDNIRRFSLTSGKFSELVNLTRQILGLDAEENIEFKYTDNEGDVITVTTDFELAEAFTLYTPNPLRLSLNTKNVVTKTPTTVHSAGCDTKQKEPSKTTPASVSTEQQQSSSKESSKSIEHDVEVERIREEIRRNKQALRENTLRLRELHLAARQQAKCARVPPAWPKKCNEVFGHKKYLARFIPHATNADYTVVPPSKPFVVTFRVRNAGTSSWPEGSNLVYISRLDRSLSAPSHVALGREVAPGEEVDIEVPLTAPEKEGLYEAYFKVALPGDRKFGQRLRCRVLVAQNAPTAVPVDTSGNAPEENKKLEESHGCAKQQTENETITPQE